MRSQLLSDAQQRAGYKRIDLVVAIGVTCLLATVLIPALSRTRIFSRRRECLNKMRNLGLGVHNYGTTNRNRLPGYGTGPEEALLHSWVVDMLPYFDSNPLGDMWDYSKPWDSRVVGNRNVSNYSLSTSPIALMICPAMQSESTTSLSYVVNAGFENQSSPDSHNFDQLGIDWNSDGVVDEADHATARDTGIFWRPTDNWRHGPGLDDFVDGTSNTILIGESTQSGRQTWAGPQAKNCAFTYPIDPSTHSLGIAEPDSREACVLTAADDQVPGILSSQHRDVSVTMGDGSIRSLSTDIDTDVLRRLVTPRGSLHGEQALEDNEF